ncbi:MAG: hypothetical protein LH606_03265 [Cytophagaceae bacterium]|nr:hypothetical protein [Cytophagaceae bacterium]
MTPKRQGIAIRKVRDIAISSTLSLALLTGSAALQSCGNSRDEQETVSRQETTFSKGVKTYITETDPGVFKITDEIPTSADSSVAIVRYFDGHRDTLNANSAKALIDKEVDGNSRQAGVGSNFSLGNALLYGGMGYFLASTLNNRRYADYRGQGNGSRFYSNPSVYQRSQNIGQQISASRSTRAVTTTRPAGGRSGFLGRSGGSSRGFGG